MDSLYHRLIAHFGGSQVATASALGVKPQVVANWKRRGLPAERALEIEAATKGRIKVREVLRSQVNGRAA